MLRLVEQDEVGGAADLDQPAIELAQARSVAGSEAEGDLRGKITQRREHRNHADDAERLHPGTRGRVGAEDHALELSELPGRAQSEQGSTLVAVVHQLQSAAALL